MADVQRLRHGAEVRLDAARERSRKRQRLGGARNVEPEKMRGRCRGSEGTERGRGVPPFVVMMKIDRTRQAHLGLDADDVSRQRPPARNLQLLAERKDRRRHGCRVVPTQHARDIVVVQRVRGRAVDQGRVQGARAMAGAEHERGPWRIGHAGSLEQNLRARLGDSRQRAADGVDDGRPCLAQRARRHIHQAKGADFLGEPRSQRRLARAVARLRCVRGSRHATVGCHGLPPSIPWRGSGSRQSCSVAAGDAPEGGARHEAGASRIVVVE